MRCLVVILAIGFLSGCQASSQYAGTGPVTVTDKLAFAMEKHLNSSTGVAMAISKGGSGWGTISCPTTQCAWREGSPEKSALALCERNGRQCAIFSVNKSVVWNGTVTLPASEDGSYVLRLIEQYEPNTSRTITGKATRNAETDEFDFDIYYKGYQCGGGTDKGEGTWALDCKGQVEVGGMLGTGSESVIWGRSQSGRFTISVQEGGWPTLREKLAERKLESSSFRRATSGGNRGHIVPSDYNASLNWPGQDGQVFGKVTRLGASSNGTLSFTSNDQKLKCEGTLEVWYGTTGAWNLDCGNGQRADGSLRVDGDFVEGNGKNREGDAVSFLSLR